MVLSNKNSGQGREFLSCKELHEKEKKINSCIEKSSRFFQFCCLPVMPTMTCWGSEGNQLKDRN